MAYRLAQDEALPQALRRIVGEEVSFAVSELRVADPARRDEGIHEARKCVKKLRGVVRLLLPVLGDAGKRENAALREIGRALSEFRDAAAMIETVDLLAAGGAEAGTLEPLRAELVRRRDSATRREGKESKDAATGDAVVALRAFRRRSNTWLGAADGFPAIAPGLKETYRAGRRALWRAADDATPVRFHDLRKRVKDHWYHVRLLEPVWAGSETSREPALRDMQEWLGDDHNLTLLLELLKAEPGIAGPANGFPNETALRAVIRRRQRELREDALAAGEELYREKPGEFLGALGHLWEGWAGLPSAVSVAAG